MRRKAALNGSSVPYTKPNKVTERERREKSHECHSYLLNCDRVSSPAVPGPGFARDDVASNLHRRAHSLYKKCPRLCRDRALPGTRRLRRIRRRCRADNVIGRETTETRVACRRLRLRRRGAFLDVFRDLLRQFPDFLTVDRSREAIESD